MPARSVLLVLNFRMHEEEGLLRNLDPQGHPPTGLIRCHKLKQPHPGSELYAALAAKVTEIHWLSFLPSFPLAMSNP